MSVYVSSEELRELIRTGEKLTLLAALWDARAGQARSTFHAAHIPTAQFCDMSVHLVGTPTAQVGRNPLPSLERLSETFGFWGIAEDRPVIVYDTGHGVFAARVWWTLRWAGVRNVRILDGGFAAWEALGFDTVAGPGPVNVHSELVAQRGQAPTIDDVHDYKGLLIDARQPNRYRGIKERLDKKAGHIPGARNLPVQDVFDSNGMVKPSDEILERFAQLGVTHTTDPASAVVYSGSGNHSAKLLAAAVHAGLPMLTHFIGGWSQWAADVTNPVSREI